ncbi:hypothetical protein J1G42_03085 [Cellulomonas sp. zg-ZUI222]|uniref:hypothetical protein n=1 Tax=Cellulomonas wangleii TaxID=2816956 RepID=UPI001A94D9FA|nr:hypothetical protein [Cellulomonas wangleii]MBO0919810.1 hypothetical protein [Cellulomonas wangleii]
MTAVDAAEQRVQELQALLAAVRAARARVPSLRRATGTVGAPGSWTGTAAHRLHHDELVPLTDQLTHGLDRAEQAVLDDLQQARRALTRAEDEQEAAERRSAS